MPERDDFRFSDVHVSPRGSRFRIVPDFNLFRIKMENGGIPPKITEGCFTSYKIAKGVLDQYFKENPKPTPREHKKEG